MKKLPELGKELPLPDEIKQAGESGNLVFFIGAGLSSSLGLPSWKELAKKSLQDLRNKNIFSPAKIEQLKHLNPKQILSVSQLANEDDFKEDLKKHLKEVKSKPGNIYETIRKIGCVCVTTNYDDLLKPPPYRSSKINASQKTGEPEIEKSEEDISEKHEMAERIHRREDIYPYLLDELGTIIHLHGCMIEANTMIVTTKDYLEHYKDPQIINFLEYLFKKKTVVFLGYGLEEDEILERLLRRGRAQKNGNIKHFNIKDFFSWETHLYESLGRYYEESFGITLRGFTRDDEDRRAIESVIKDWEKQMDIQPPSLYEDIKIINKMNESDVAEMDVLHRIKNKPDLQPLFFRQAKELKWFSLLLKEGYFDPSNLPRPKPSEKEGFIIVPPWDAVNYLANTASELNAKESEEYSKKFLSIVECVTKYARKKGISNYHVWWHFAEILLHIPHNFMSEETSSAIGYWLEDKYAPDIVARIIGKKLLPELLNKQGNHAADIAITVLSKLFQVSFKQYPHTFDETWQKACFRLENYQVKKIIETLALKSGERLGKKGVTVFHHELTRVLKKLKNDGYSSMWQPAIENHDQNSLHDRVENLLVLAYRDSLEGFIQSSPDEAKKYLQELLDNEYETIQRIAIHHIGQGEKSYEDFWDCIIDKKFFRENFRHETWHFLNLNYSSFSEKQRQKVFDIIQEISRKDKKGKILEKQTACLRSCWLASIKDHGEDEKTSYQNEVKIAGKEPENPDFPSYMSIGEKEPTRSDSPYTKDEINGMEILDLVEELKSFKTTGGWEEPNVFGFSRNFKDAIISNPLRYFEHLREFKDLDLAYVHSVITAYRNLWREKIESPWDDIWFHLLQYISEVIKREGFWDTDSNDNDNQNGYAANRNDVVKSISALIEEGAKSDDHAFDEKNHDKAEDILKCILKNQKGDPFNENSSFDALTIAINSPRGQCLEALINMALRHCRLADKKNDGNHINAWKKFQPYFDTELKQKNDVNYEFFALIPRYIPNFLYMSQEWLMQNLEAIFDQNDNKKWTCAIHGYAYLSRFDIEVYQHLKSRGHIIRALNDKDLPQKCSVRFVRNAVHSFLANKERLNDEDSIIHILLSRGKRDEIHEIIHFICSFRPEDRGKITLKVYELWPRIQKIIRDIGFSSEDGHNLVSSLCRWTEFLDQIDDENKDWLLEIAPYVHFSHFSYDFLENLARLSKQYPFETNKILQAMVSRVSERTYGFLGAEEQIKTILENLINEDKGKHAAEETASEFAKKDMFQPSKILQEIERISQSNFTESE